MKRGAAVLVGVRRGAGLGLLLSLVVVVRCAAGAALPALPGGLPVLVVFYVGGGAATGAVAGLLSGLVRGVVTAALVGAVSSFPAALALAGLLVAPAMWRLDLMPTAVFLSSTLGSICGAGIWAIENDIRKRLR